MAVKRIGPHDAVMGDHDRCALCNRLVKVGYFGGVQHIVDRVNELGSRWNLRAAGSRSKTHLNLDGKSACGVGVAVAEVDLWDESYRCKRCEAVARKIILRPKIGAEYYSEST